MRSRLLSERQATADRQHEAAGSGILGGDAFGQAGRQRHRDDDEPGIGGVGQRDDRVARRTSPTSRPTVRTMPLTSLPRIAGSARGKSFCRAPERIFQSIVFTLVATASIMTASGAMTGSGTSRSYTSVSGPP